MNTEKEKVICGIQQVGIGVEDLQTAWKWYNKHLNIQIPMVDDEGVAERMLPYTGGKPQPRHAILAISQRGGGGFEIWQPQGRKVVYPTEPVRLGDLGINICKVKAKDVKRAYNYFKDNNITILSDISVSPLGIEHFYMQDPWGNIFEIEKDDYCFINVDQHTGGSNGVVIGVSDMEKSIEFYKKLLDYDIVAFDKTDVFDDFGNVLGGKCKIRRVELQRSKPVCGPLSELMGNSHLELIQNLEIEPRKTLEGRWWGDPGFIHLCFDVRNMSKVHEAALALGHDFVCDSGDNFDMGDANGHFTYVEDPDGTLIEFVETFKIPVIRKLGISINLKKRDDYKPLPRIITKALRFMKVSFD